MPVGDSFFNPVVALRVNNKDASDLEGVLTDFKYNDHFRKADQAEIIFRNRDLVLIDDDRLYPDSLWEVRWGYPSDLSDIKRMRCGYFVPTFPESGEPEIKVYLWDFALEAARLSFAFNWGKVSSSDIVKRVGKRYGFKTNITASNDKTGTPYMQPSAVSDWEYILHLADDIDFELFMDGDTLVYRPKAYGERPIATAYYYMGTVRSVLKSFKPTVKKHRPSIGRESVNTKTGKATHATATNTTGSDPSLGKVVPEGLPPTEYLGINFRSEDVFGIVTFTREDKVSGKTEPTPETDAGKAKRVAKAKKRRVLDRVVKASAEFIGSPRLRAKKNLQILGIGRKLSGNWYILEATHHITGNGTYDTSVKLKRGALNAGKGKTTKNPNLSTPGTGEAGAVAGLLSSIPTIAINFATGTNTLVQAEAASVDP